MFELESKLIKAVQIKSNKKAHDLAEEILKIREDSENNIRSQKNTIIQLLAIFSWNQMKNINDSQSLKFCETEKNKLLSKIENDESENLDEILHYKGL